MAVKNHNTKKHLGEVGTGSNSGNSSPPATPSSKPTHSKSSLMETENSFSIPKPNTQKTHYKKLPTAPIPISYNPFAILNTHQSLHDPPRPFLKRS